MADQAHGPVKVNSSSKDPWSSVNARDSAVPAKHTGEIQSAGDTLSVGTMEVSVSEDAWSDTATAGRENIYGR